ncbi:hypothetical protein BGZ63DRAFT_419815 [Mariannaea sp. PMI_226]|nr:hypothetical protein BGZ63DRAFT_419815 [Mariannaea sp. PMI_226]
MSSSFGELPPGLAASREDFELFRRLMRVARLMELQDGTALVNQDCSLTTYTPHTRPNSGFLQSNIIPNTPLGIEEVVSMENDYNYEDEDEDDDSDHDDKEVEEASEGSPITEALFSPSIGLGVAAARNSQSTSGDSQQGITRTPAQRRRQQQQQQQQQKRRKQMTQEQPRQRQHAAVEKRYRSVLNSKIQQLNELIPSSNTYCLPGSGQSQENQRAGETDRVPTKAIVLDRALQYMNNLVSTYEQYERERNELRSKMQAWLDSFDAVDVQETIDA